MEYRFTAYFEDEVLRKRGEIPEIAGAYCGL
jgi:hypothetical protein